jgi:hypothetical protein
MKAVKGEEIFLATENKVGKLEEIAGLIQQKGINIRAINGYAVENKAFFRLVTSDNAKTKEALQAAGKVESKEVVIAEMPDEVGQLHRLTSKLKNAGIDLTHIYGTTSQPKGSAIIVFSSKNNDKALEVLSQD